MYYTATGFGNHVMAEEPQAELENNERPPASELEVKLLDQFLKDGTIPSKEDRNRRIREMRDIFVDHVKRKSKHEGVKSNSIYEQTQLWYAGMTSKDPEKDRRPKHNNDEKMNSTKHWMSLPAPDFETAWKLEQLLQVEYGFHRGKDDDDEKSLKRPAPKDSLHSVYIFYAPMNSADEVRKRLL